MLPRPSILSEVPVSDTQYSDMGMNTPRLILGKKHVKFSEYFRVQQSDMYSCWTLLADQENHLILVFGS